MVPFDRTAYVALILFIPLVVLSSVHADEVLQRQTSEKKKELTVNKKQSVPSQPLFGIATSDAVQNEDYPYRRQRRQLFQDGSAKSLSESNNNKIINAVGCDLKRLHQSCNGPLDDCGCTSDTIECSLTQGICVRTPRDYGEPCSIFNPCGEYSTDNPSMALRCSYSCGICVAESEGSLAEEALTALDQYDTVSIDQEENLYDASASSRTTFDTSCLGGLESSSFFRTWARTELTSLPILRPTNDDELRSILLAASANGCKVRPMGTTHSAAGVVASEKDLNVVVVSLVDYTPNDNNGEGWDKVTIIEDADGSSIDKHWARVRVPGGYTQLQLYSVIRPRGYFLPAQTAGWLFTMGGIVSNSVHGGNFGRSYVHSYVTRLRVMLANGTVQVLDKEEDLRMWRNGFGLLGFITAVEFQIEKRDTEEEYFWMGFESQTLPDSNNEWNHSWFDEYIGRIKQEYTAAQFFFDPLSKEMTAIVQKNKPRELNNSGNTSTFNDNSCIWSYWKSQCVCKGSCDDAGQTCSYQYKFGDVTLSQSCRLDATSFIPKTDEACTFDYSITKCRYAEHCSYQFVPGDLTLEQSCRLINSPPPTADRMQLSYNTILEENPSLGLTGAVIGNDETQQSLNCLANQFSQDAIMRRLVVSQIKQYVKDAYATTNDGFIVREGITLPSPYLGYMFPAEYLFDVLDQISSLNYILTVPIEFRFVNADDSAVLMPGDRRNAEFVFMECVSLEIPGYTTTTWREQFFDIEQIFKGFGGVPHTGKYFGMGRDEVDGIMKPFQNISSEDIFKANQKEEFETYRKQIDPNDLFYAGFMAEYLQS